MYDRKTEANEFVGDSVDEAKASAARFYGIETSDLKICVADEFSVAGLQGRSAIVAFPKGVVPGSKPGDDGGSRGGRGGDRGGRSDRGGDRGGRGDRGDRGGRGDRGDRGGRGDRGDRGGRPRGGERGDSSASASAAPERSDEGAAVAAAPSEPQESKGTASGDLSAVGNFVLGVLERMGLGDFEMTETREEGSDLTVIQLRGAASTALSAGGVRTAEALQLLANQAAKQASPDGG